MIQATPHVIIGAIVAMALASITIGRTTLAARAQSKDPVRPADSLRVQSENLIYQGAFRLPRGNFGDSQFNYGEGVVAFNPVHKSLFIVGHAQQQYVAEVTIPVIRTGELTTLAVATVL